MYGYNEIKLKNNLKLFAVFNTGKHQSGMVDQNVI